MSDQPTSPALNLVGTWRLVEFWDQPSPDQPKQFPFGEHPLGYFVYDRSGHVHIQIARNPLLAPMSSEELSHASAEELRLTIESYVAYCGTYTVDAERGVVTHHVEADVRRLFTGTDQERPFQMTENELRISDGRSWFRRLIRVE
ncbi:MAG TPA: lipocalin-like domain-containing protein [Vicinamibacterales bacterium]